MRAVPCAHGPLWDSPGRFARVATWGARRVSGAPVLAALQACAPSRCHLDLPCRLAIVGRVAE
eukprot:14380477-Alexandrium_andersonii.AAC.1